MRAAGRLLVRLHVQSPVHIDAVGAQQMDEVGGEQGAVGLEEGDPEGDELLAVLAVVGPVAAEARRNPLPEV